MNMKKKSGKLWLVCLLAIFPLLFACKNEHEIHSHKTEHLHSEDTVYACPMRCEGDKTYSEPGRCPVCKMFLEPVGEKLVQTVSPDRQVLSRQATLKLQAGNSGNAFNAQGFITIAQNRNRSVSARFGGRVEKLFVRFGNQYVKQGDKIMDIYSPSLRTFQEEHLFLVRSAAEHVLIEKSRDKLRLLGLTGDQVEQLEENGSVSLTVPVYSPVDGFVFFNIPAVEQNQTEANGTTMNSMSSGQSPKSNAISFAATSGQIRKGMYVNEGQTLFSVNDLKEVWALVSVTGVQLSQIRQNQPVRVSPESNPSTVLRGKIALTEPIFEEEGQRFARIRVVLPNSDNSLKINSLVKAQFSLNGTSGFEVPSSAVYKTGLNTFVWVKSGTMSSGTGIFRAKKVIAGQSREGMTPIKSGLSPEDEIAIQAGLMIDSESFITEY